MRPGIVITVDTNVLRHKVVCRCRFLMMRKVLMLIVIIMVFIHFDDLEDDDDLKDVDDLEDVDDEFCNITMIMVINWSIVYPKCWIESVDCKCVSVGSNAFADFSVCVSVCCMILPLPALSSQLGWYVSWLCGGETMRPSQLGWYVSWLCGGETMRPLTQHTHKHFIIYCLIQKIILTVWQFVVTLVPFLWCFLIC